MSRRHPIISITGSSGAGTTSVKKTFENIFRRENVKAAYERSDVCVVPAAGVAAEAMVALPVERLMVEKFGGDSLGEMKRNFAGYREQIRAY